MRPALRPLLPALWLALACTAFAQAPPDPAPGATLDSVLALAREHNPELRAMRLEADAAQARTAQAAALPDPRLRLELQDITRMGTQAPSLLPGAVGSTRYTLTQELPWFGVRDLRRAQGEDGEAMARSQAQALWAELAGRVRQAWVQLWLQGRSLALSQELAGLLQHLQALAQARYAAGLGSQQDVLRAQTELLALRAELIALEGEQQQARARLNGVLGRPAQAALAEPVQLPALPAADTLAPEALQARLQEHNPQLAADAARAQQAGKGVQLARAGRYPTLMLGVAPTQIEGELKAWDLMLELNLPLQQGTRRAQEQEAQALLEAAHQRREATSAQLRAELGEAAAALQSARRTEALIAGSLLPQAELSWQSALAGYEAGRSDISTVLEAQRQIRQARLTLIKNQAESHTRWAQMARLLGEDL